ncbi:MAG: MotA/TolQ/ExbB proton channel family protein [Paludibacteraceae bacterium]|nr:MotA/TolQ/ExbB proton channel family protein [Paludibacteraceae bacterium]MDD6357302.1 MotA/TolQ/ExbB proton channel family protein [Bacteroidales bacterium]
MKKVIALFAFFTMLNIGMVQSAFAQDEVESEAVEVAEEQVAAEEETAVVEEVVAPAAAEEVVAEPAAEQGLHKVLKQKVIEGGAGFVGALLLCFILGLALAIERILYLNLASTDTKKLLSEVEEALNNGGVEAAKDVCRNTRGPVASIFYQGLLRYDEGIDVVEKTVVSYGGVQTGLLEKNMSWISLFIGIAPMLGFLGTVIGMIEAFDRIQQAGDLSATVVAGGIKVALITTVGGLIVGMILQLFYNYIVSKIDDLVNDMEDASISLLDLVLKYNLKK